MLDFPKSTVFNRKIPKQKFYDNLQVSSNIKQQFVKEIESINWKNKLSQDTLNINVGTNVKEIEIIEINLKEQKISKNILELIDKGIPYHLVFILKYKNLGQIWISYKEGNKKSYKFRIDSYCQTSWMNYDELNLKIEGLDLDKIYENFIIQVAGEKLSVEPESDIKVALIKAKEREKLETTIEKLEKKIKNEKQFNQQVKLLAELRKIKKELDNLR